MFFVCVSKISCSLNDAFVWWISRICYGQQGLEASTYSSTCLGSQSTHPMTGMFQWPWHLPPRASVRLPWISLSQHHSPQRFWAASEPPICLHSVLHFLHSPLCLHILLIQLILLRKASEVLLLFPKAHIDPLFLLWRLTLSRCTHLAALKSGSQDLVVFSFCGACKQAVTSGDTRGVPGI